MSEIVFQSLCPPMGRSLSPLRRMRFVMGTTLDIQAWGNDEQSTQSAITKAFFEVSRLEASLSVYRDSSEVTRLNQRLGREPVAVSNELARLIGLSKKYSDMTDGAFDVTTGALIDFWARRTTAPGPADLSRVKESTGWNNLVIDDRNRKVSSLVEGLRLNFGAIGKGFALDRAAEVLVANGIKRALLNFGGQILVAGEPPSQDGWRITIANPAKRLEPLYDLSLRSGSIATTSQHERFREIGGARVGHVLDPRTGWPVKYEGSLCLHAPTAAEADALSTSVFIMGRENGLSWVNSLGPEIFAAFHEFVDYRLTYKFSTHFIRNISRPFPAGGQFELN